MFFVKAKSLLTKWNGMNIYRGCAHGCIYCDSRSSCYRFSHPFEDIEVKENAPELLEKILLSKKKPCMISTGSMSDPYQPCEAELGLTKKCLNLLKKYNYGASVITKSDLVLRDIDIFAEINSRSKAVLQMTLTIADEILSRKIEPNVCTSKRRYEVLKEFQKRNIPAVAWLAPVIPGITDNMENISKILEWCIDAGVKGIVCFGAGMTLRRGNREYFCEKAEKLFPGMGMFYSKKYEKQYSIVSPQNDKLMVYFHETCEKYGIIHNYMECFEYIHSMPCGTCQPTLF